MQLFLMALFFLLAAGRTTTNEELEDMLESGKLAIFTDDVCIWGLSWLVEQVECSLESMWGC